MDQFKNANKIIFLLSITMVVNILLFAYLIITTYKYDRKIEYLERKIEVLEIHIFPGLYEKPGGDAGA